MTPLTEILLIVPVAMLIVSLAFLWRARHVITPAGALLSFVARDFLWIICLIIEYAILRGPLPLGMLEVVLFVQFIMVSLLLYSMVNRYHLQWREAIYRKDIETREEKLESTKNWTDHQ